MGEFQKLRVWSLSKELAIEVYKIVQNNPEFKRDLRFAGQITSSAISVPSNIAEGDELKTHKQGINHFYIAKGSLAELKTQVIIATEVGLIQKSISDELLAKAEMISVALYKIIQARKYWK